MRDMQRHVDLAGYLNIAWGALYILGALLVLFFVGGGGALSGDREAFAITLGVSGLIGTVLLILGVPSIVAGFGLLRRHSWARPLVIVMSVIHFFSFPFGTALGAYSIWVVTREEVRAELT